MSDVIQFPPETRQAVVTRLEGLADREIQRLVAECAHLSSELFVITPDVGVTDEGARWVSITVDNRVEPMCIFCREGGEIVVYDADGLGGNCGEDVLRGSNKVVERLRQALKRDNDDA